MIRAFFRDWRRHSLRSAWWNLTHMGGSKYIPVDEWDAWIDLRMAYHLERCRRETHQLMHHRGVTSRVMSRLEGQELR